MNSELFLSFHYFPFKMASIRSLRIWQKLKEDQGIDEYRLLTPKETLTGANSFMNATGTYKFGFGDSKDLKAWLHNLDDLKSNATDKYNKYCAIDQFELQSVKRKIFPKCRESLIDDYILMRAIKKTMDYGEIGSEVIKAILFHKPTGNYLFLTGHNVKPSKEHYHEAIENSWFVYKANMVAPLGFWEMVRDCL